jgi:superoxide dismutase
MRKTIKNKSRKNVKHIFSKHNKTYKKSLLKKLKKLNKSLKEKNKKTKMKKNKMKKTKRSKVSKQKGGKSLPFAELSNVGDSMSHGIGKITNMFQDNPATAPSNPASPLVNPSVSSQFIRTDALSQSVVGPDLAEIFKGY